MKFTVNNVVITVVESGLYQGLSEVKSPEMFIDATTEDGSTHHCTWRLEETFDGSELFAFNNTFDTRNPIHGDFREWLIIKTACSKDEAIKAMHDIYTGINKRICERIIEESRWDEEEALNWLEDYLRDSDSD